jgi:hypothetical protein
MDTLMKLLPIELCLKIFYEHCDIDTRVKNKVAPLKILPSILTRMDSLFLKTKENIIMHSSKDEMKLSKLFLSSDNRTIFHYGYTYSKMDSLNLMHFSSWKNLRLCTVIQDENQPKLYMTKLQSTINSVSYNYKDNLSCISKCKNASFEITDTFVDVLLTNHVIHHQ